MQVLGSMSSEFGPGGDGADGAADIVHGSRGGALGPVSWGAMLALDLMLRFLDSVFWVGEISARSVAWGELFVVIYCHCYRTHLSMGSRLGVNVIFMEI